MHGAVKCAAARGRVRRGTLNIPKSCRGAPAGKAEHGHSISILWPRASGYAVLGEDFYPTIHNKYFIYLLNFFYILVFEFFQILFYNLMNS
jgi:hypothetical protein